MLLIKLLCSSQDSSDAGYEQPVKVRCGHTNIFIQHQIHTLNVTQQQQQQLGTPTALIAFLYSEKVLSSAPLFPVTQKPTLADRQVDSALAASPMGAVENGWPVQGYPLCLQPEVGV